MPVIHVDESGVPSSGPYAAANAVNWNRMRFAEYVSKWYSALPRESTRVSPICSHDTVPAVVGFNVKDGTGVGHDVGTAVGGTVGEPVGTAVGLVVGALVGT